MDLERAFKQGALEREAVSDVGTPMSRYFQGRERVAKLSELQKSAAGLCIAFPREDADTASGDGRKRSVVEKYRYAVADWLYAHVKYTP